jgi:hypothetical protein
MNIHQENEPVAAGGNLLTPREKTVCKQIATGEAPHSQRAVALLALNKSSTRAEAAEQANLSTGQINYWIAKFRKQRLGMFPETLLAELDAENAVELVAAVEEELEADREKVDSAADKTEEAKAKKGKEVKPKSRKAKKEKKGKVKKKSKKEKKEKKGKSGKKSKKAKKEKKGKKKTNK